MARLGLGVNSPDSVPMIIRDGDKFVIRGIDCADITNPARPRLPSFAAPVRRRDYRSLTNCRSARACLPAISPRNDGDPRGALETVHWNKDGKARGRVTCQQKHSPSAEDARAKHLSNQYERANVLWRQRTHLRIDRIAEPSVETLGEGDRRY